MNIQVTEASLLAKLSMISILNENASYFVTEMKINIHQHVHIESK